MTKAKRSKSDASTQTRSAANDQQSSSSPAPESATSYQSLLHVLPDAYLAVDQSGQIQEWSPRAEELFGWSAAQVQDRSAQELGLPDNFLGTQPQGLPVFVRAIGRRTNSGLLQYLAINASGEEFPVEMSVIHTTTVNTKQCQMVLIKDISHRLVAEERLAQASKMEAIGQLVSGLAHDFNNVLGIILGSLETLEIRVKDPTNQELVKLAILATERGNEVTHAMQAVARRRPAKQEYINLNAALRELNPLLTKSVSNSIQLSVIAEADQAEVMIDVGAFNNVVLNFIINARDAMPNGGMAMIYTQNISVDANDPLESIDLASGNYIVLGVDDSGTGMSPEVAARAMEPFFTTKPKGKGTGLGLAMAYAFARQSGGALRIRSVPDRGTNIHLFIPTLSTSSNIQTGAWDD